MERLIPGKGEIYEKLTVENPKRSRNTQIQIKK